MKGSVEIYLKKPNMTLYQLKNKGIFGEIGFITEKRFASAKSKDISIIFTLSRKKFLSILRKHSYDNVNYDNVLL